MPRRYRRLDDDWVRALVRQVVDENRSITQVARRAGVNQHVLSRRIRALGLEPPRRRSGPQGRLVFRAACSECGQVIEATQVGDSSDAAWRLWERLARRHAIERHGITAGLSGRWADALWYVRGERINEGVPEMCILDGPEGGA